MCTGDLCKGQNKQSQYPLAMLVTPDGATGGLCWVASHSGVLV